MKKKPKSGATVIEATIAIAILAIGVAGASRLMLAAAHLSDQATEKGKAIQLVANRIERMAMADFADLSLWEEDGMVSNSKGEPDANGHFKISTAITYPSTNLAEVVFQIQTKNRKTLEFDLPPETITTYLTEM